MSESNATPAQLSNGRGDQPLRVRDAPVAYVVSAVALAAAFVALLWVPSYAHATPTLGGFPFFYWYSLLWLLLNAGCQLLAYQLLVAGPRRRRSRRGVT